MLYTVLNMSDHIESNWRNHLWSSEWIQWRGWKWRWWSWSLSVVFLCHLHTSLEKTLTLTVAVSSLSGWWCNRCVIFQLLKYCLLSQSVRILNWPFTPKMKIFLLFTYICVVPNSYSIIFGLKFFFSGNVLLHLPCRDNLKWLVVVKL